MLNVIDSSAWLDYFADGPNADTFAEPIEDPALLVVPTITLLEVFKRIAAQRGEGPALQAVAVMHQGKMVDLDSSIALLAARIGAKHSLPLADSVILATTRIHDATLWSQDSDFQGLEDVRYFPTQRN